MRRNSWTRAPSHMALALTLALGVGCGTGQERRTFPVELTSQPMVGANERGWTVALEAAHLSVGPVRFYEGRVLLSQRWPRFDLYSLIGGTAHAHPGHYVAGDAMGELLSTRTVDLLAAEPTVLGEADAVTGDYGSMELTLATATSTSDAEGVLQGRAIRLLGRATHTDGRAVRFETTVELQQPISGIRFERAMDAAPGRVRITVNLTKWLGRIDFVARIAACDPKLHSIIATNPHALRDARQLDAERAAGKVRGPLHGIPVIIKDNIDFAGMATTAGSLALSANVRERSAPLVDSLVAAGAVVIAKANLSEWANFRSNDSSSGWSAVGGLAVNPLDVTRTACGSSSGSATAVVARFAPVSIGTETNGSIVCPSSITGLVGLKPTVGLVPGAGIVPISHTQDTAGPMTASVADAALLLDALAAPRAGGKRLDYHAGLRADALKGTRLGVVRFLEGFSPATRRAFDASLEVLKAQGAELVEIAEFDMGELERLQLPILLSEFKADLNAYLATTPPAVKTRTLADVIAFNDAEPRELAHFGQDLFVLAQETKGLDDPDYVEQLRRAKALSGTLGIDKLLREHDVAALVAPTTGPAWTIDLINGDHYTGGSSTLAAMSGYPHLTVPMGDVAGMPVGLSFFGRAWDEQALLSLGHSFERAYAEGRSKKK